MNGNRGAKGSIKDRLISMLYRFRYKQKTLKEENYTVKNKEKQIDYLNILQDFKENENVEVFDDNDKEKLDDVKFDVNFKIGIQDSKLENVVDVELSDIEMKTSELETPVNIKKEIKKTKEEVVILKEVNDFVQKSLENIEDIKACVEELKEETKEKNKDTKEVEDKYIKLKEKIEKLKKQYDTIKDKYDLSEFSIVESIKLIDSIENYKTLASLNELDMMLNVCKKEIKKIDSITIIDESKKAIGSNIQSVKKEQKDVKIKFNKNKDYIDELKSVEEKIAQEYNIQKEIVDDMYEKATHYERQISILSSFLRITGGILTLPFTGKNLFGVALGSTMINKGLKELNKNLETREKLVISYKYEDISSKINEVKDKVEYINLVLSDSLNEIKKLKSNFNNLFKDYDNILPEYQSTLDNINSLEARLIEQQYKLNSMDKKLDKEKEMNNQKLKIVKK